MQDTDLSRRYDIYGAVTAKILRGMKQAKGTYRMPWHTGDMPLEVPTNALTDHPYRGVNIVSLWVDGLQRGYARGYWASYKQWQQLGAQVRYGERGSLIIFYKKLHQTQMEKEAGEHPLYVGKASYVFNAAQVDNWKPPEPRRVAPVEIEDGGGVRGRNGSTRRAWVPDGPLSPRPRHHRDAKSRLVLRFANPDRFPGIPRRPLS